MRIAVLCAALALLPLVAISQQQSAPRSRQDATNTKRDTKHNSGRPASESKRVDSPGKQQRRGNDQGEKSPTLLEVLNIVFNGILATTAILGTIAIGRQLSLMRRQMTDAEESAKGAREETERAIRVAESQATSLRDLAIATGRSVAIAEAQMAAITDIARASLTVTSVGPIKRLDRQPLLAFVYVKNTGLTTAKAVEVQSSSQVVDGMTLPAQPSEYAPDPDDPHQIDSRADVGAGASISLTVSLPPFSESDLRRIRSFSASLWIWGNVSYKDVFGAKRTLSYIYRYGALTHHWHAGRAADQPEGNGDDDDATPTAKT